MLPVREQDQQSDVDMERPRAPTTPATVAPLVATVSVAARIGNRAFAAQLHRAPPTGATAAPPTQGSGTWTAPADWGKATTHAEAIPLLFRIRGDAGDLKGAGFDDLGVTVDEAQTWIGYLGTDPGAALRDDDARKLTDFGHEFEDKQRAALQQVVQAVVTQLSEWSGPPISDDDLFDLREAVHEQFKNEKKDMLENASELLKSVTEFSEKAGKWSGYAAKAQEALKAGKSLKELNEAIEGISKEVKGVKTYFDLAHNIGIMVGKLGGTPAGIDDVAAVSATLEVMDFTVGKLGVPGFNLLWGGYILPMAKACLKGIQSLKGILYKQDREGGVRLFFEEHRGDATAPKIDDALFHGDSGQHFPGGQAMLNFMWQLIREPDLVTSVPGGIEDFFLKWREEMGAGEDEQIQSDSSWKNLWNLFSHEHSPNLVPWLQRHADEAWIKLYGGMPKPD
jgi:hypothetical protein